MRQLLDTVWQRRGISWIWDEEARNQVCQASEVWSLRQLLRGQRDWSEDLPSNEGQTLVVAGLDSCLDLLEPSEAEEWLGEAIKSVILSFQAFYESDGALVFWLPSGHNRLKIHPATDAVTWQCGAPHGGATLDFGRLLWGEAREYPQEIVLTSGGKPAGLYHRRIT